MKRQWLLGAIISVGLAVSGAQAQEIGLNQRLLESFVEDGTLVRQGWMEARARYSNWERGEDTSAGILLSFRVLDHLEVGGGIGYMDRGRVDGESLFGEELTSNLDENGLTDLDLFGKFGLGRRDWKTSFGLVVKFPTGDEKKRLGSGATDYKFFGATRRTRGRNAWVGHVGFRINGDSRTPGKEEGETSWGLGGGWIIQLSYQWSFLAEVRFETKRYSGADPDARIIPGLDFRPTENFAVRLGVAVGVSDGAPDYAPSVGTVFQF